MYKYFCVFYYIVYIQYNQNMISNKEKKIINWEKIYLNYENELSFLREIFFDLQNEIEIEIKDLKKNIDFENHEKIYNISHKIKGTLSNFYCEETCDIMSEINDISKERKLKNSNEKIYRIRIQYLFNDFCKKFEYVKKEIDFFINSSKNN